MNADHERVVAAFRDVGEFLGCLIAQGLGVSQGASTAQPASSVRDGRLLRLREAAEYLGIGRTALCELKRAGKVPFVMVKSRPMYRRSDLDQYAESIKAEDGPRRRGRPRNSAK